MISVSGKKWIERKVNKNLVEKIQQDYKFDNILSKLIVSRNYDENEEFIYSSFKKETIKSFRNRMVIENRY